MNHGRDIVRRDVNVIAQPLQRDGEPILFNRFQQIVDRAALESLNGELVVGRAKNNLGALANFCRHIKPRLERHANIEKTDVRLRRLEFLQCILTVYRFGDHFKVIRMQRQQFTHAITHQRFIVGKKAADFFHVRSPRLCVFRLRPDEPAVT